MKTKVEFLKKQDGERSKKQELIQSDPFRQKANDEKKDYLVRALAKNIETTKKINLILDTSLSETDLSYAVQMEDAYVVAVQMVNDLRRVIQIGDGIVVKSGEARRYGRMIEPLESPVEISYINGLLKLKIPTFPSRGIKKESDLRAIEDAVTQAISRFLEHTDASTISKMRKFAMNKYVIYEQYILPDDELLDIDRVDFSNVIDLLSIEFCSGYDDSDHLRQHIQAVKNWGTRSYANIYVVLEDEYKNKLEWIEKDL